MFRHVLVGLCSRRFQGAHNSVVESIGFSWVLRILESVGGGSTCVVLGRWLVAYLVLSGMFLGRLVPTCFLRCWNNNIARIAKIQGRLKIH